MILTKIPDIEPKKAKKSKLLKFREWSLSMWKYDNETNNDTMTEII